jgi:hypothetical protein
VFCDADTDSQSYVTEQVPRMELVRRMVSSSLTIS